MDNIGKWIMKETTVKSTTLDREPNSQTVTPKGLEIDKEIRLIYCDEDGEPAFSNDTKEIVNLDYLKYEEPQELLKAFIYNKHKYDQVKVENICADLTKVTGTSWNKRFKSKYGPIEKFLRKYDDIFNLTEDKRYVWLKPHKINILASSMSDIKEEEKKPEVVSEVKIEFDEDYEKEKDLKCHWFDFDDSRVTPMYSSKIQSQFEGKESAYMLFYRRSSLASGLPKTNPCDKIGDWLKTAIKEENRKLSQKREDYDNKINMVELEVYLEVDFYLG